MVLWVIHMTCNASPGREALTLGIYVFHQPWNMCIYLHKVRSIYLPHQRIFLASNQAPHVNKKEHSVNTPDR